MMNRMTLFATSLLVVSAPVAAQAAAQDEVLQAAKKLAQAGSCSWKTSIEGGRWAGGAAEGKLGQDGLALLTLSRGENTIQVAIKGDKAAVQTGDGWQSVSELEAGTGDEAMRGRFLAAMVRNFKVPAVEAEELVKKAANLTLAEGVYTAALTEAGAKDLLTFGRRGGDGGDGPQVNNAKGSVKFWVKDGVLSKYQHQVQGTMSWNGNDREIDRTTTIEINNVGSTKVDLPEGAKAKLL